MEKKTEYIDLIALMGRLWKRKKLYMKVIAVTFVLSYALIVCVPRTYTSTMKMVPEESEGISGGALGSIASSFGFDLGSMGTTDAITPLVYPDVFESPQFLSTLLPVRVQSLDGTVDTNFYDYIMHGRDMAWWSRLTRWAKGLLPKKADPLATQDPSVIEAEKQGYINPERMTRSQEQMFESLSKSINYTFDKKTGVITLVYSDQEALITATVLEQIGEKLQEFIIDYRTRKSRNDMDYYQQLTDEAHEEYVTASRAYSEFMDANKGLSSQASRIRQQNLENEMSIRYQTYSTFMAQYQAARAKIQERTPAFSIIQRPYIPTRPTGPKRLLFVVAMCFLAGIVTTVYLFWGDIKKQLTHVK